MVNIKSAPPTLPFDTPVTGMGVGRMRDAVNYFKIKQGKKLKIIQPVWQTVPPQWGGGRLFDGSTNFFYENCCNSRVESRKIDPK